MCVYVSNLANINHKEIVESNKSKWKPLYVILCGICSEYVINKLSTNDNDLIYHQIRSYYVNGDISSRKLLEQFKIMDDLSPILKDIDISDTSMPNYEKITNSIKWDFKYNRNSFTINGFAFETPCTFLKQQIVDGNTYCLSYIEISKKPRFTTIQCDHDEYESIEETDKVFEEINGNKPVTSKKDLMDDETFFNLTNELRTADDDQRTAITSGIDKNLLIIAGAGSGKTRSLVGRLTYLHLVKQIPIGRIILLSYTNAATSSMKQAAIKQLDAAYLRNETETEKRAYINGSTIDAFFKRLIEEEWAEMGFTRKPDFYYDKVKDVDYRLGMLSSVLKDNHMLDLINEKRNISSLYKDLCNHAKGIYVNVPGIDSVLKLLIDKQIEESSIIDFVFAGCILDKTLSDGNNELFRKICSRFDCILIDEFQDVNKIQNDVLSHFYDSNIHFTFVGDDDQSIYKFNGSDNGIIKRMREDGSCVVVPLSINYRSNPNIVNAGNDILKKIPNRSKNDIEIKPHKKEGSRIHISRCNGNYSDLAHEVERVYYAGDKDDTICILCRKFNSRKNKMGQIIDSDGLKIKHALELEHIPFVEDSDDDNELSDGYKILKALLFIFNKDKVKGNLDYLLEYSSSEIASIDLYNMLCGRSNSQLSDYEDNSTLHDILKLAESVNVKTGFAKDFVSLVSNYCRAYSELIEGNSSPDRFVSDDSLYSFYKFVEGYDWDYPVGKDLLESIFYKFEETVTKKTKKELTPNKKSVILRTIHKSKGLEYNTVFIAGLNNDEYPDTSLINWKYNKIENELKELEKSEEYLYNLRSTVNEDTIVELIANCETDDYTPSIKESFAKMKKVIEKNKRDLINLSGDGIEAYTDAFFYYISSHESNLKDLIKSKEMEKQSYIEQSSTIENEIYDMDDNTTSEYKDRFNEITNEIIELKKSKTKVEQEIEKLKEQLDGYRKKLSHLYNFNKKCIQADGYLRQKELINDKKAIKKRLEKDKEDEMNEERRLFYVAVSRAIDNLYLCYDKSKLPSEFIGLISKDYCDDYEMKTRPEDEETKRLRSFINDARRIATKEEPEIDAVDDAIDAIVRNSNVDFLISYLKDYLNNNPQFNNLPHKASVYFNKAIQMMGLSERLGVNLRIEILFNLERFVHLFLSYCVGDDVEYLDTDINSSESIGADIRKTLREKCKIERIPSLSYFRELFTLPLKKDKLSKCKNIVFESYVICSDIYDVSDEIIDTWGIETIKDPDGYMCAAVDLINMRNEMVHSNDDPWITDYLPYAFKCIDTIMKNIRCKDKTRIIDRKTIDDYRKDGFSATELRYIGYSAKQLKDAGYTAEQLKDAGYDLESKELDFTADQLKEFGYSAKRLRKAGFSLDTLIEANYSTSELKEAGFTAEDLFEMGFSSIELKKANFTVEEMKKAGYSVIQLKVAGYSLIEILRGGYPAVDFKGAGFSFKELIEAGFSLRTIKNAGYEAKPLKDAGYSAKELKDAGYSEVQLKNAGYLPKELIDADYSLKEIRNAGYDASELKNDGYTAYQLKNAGYTAYQLKNAGYPLDELVYAEFSGKALREMGFSFNELVSAGCSAKQMIEAGYSFKELIDANYSLDQLLDADCPASVLREYGFSIGVLREAGFTTIQLNDAGFTAEELVSVGCPAKELLQANISAWVLKNCGVSAKELREGGISFETLSYIGYSVTELLSAGFPISEFRRKGYNKEIMLKAGCTPEQLKDGGYP